MTVHIFQIGCSGLGRLGFEKFTDKEKFFPEDLVFKGVCEKDFEHRENAESFADTAGVDLEFYNSVDDLYNAAKKVNGNVLIYDAGPVKRHSNHIQRSLSNDFHHLSEKPPSLDRSEHIKERKLAAEHDVHYKVDFIERENPVVKKMLEILKDEKINDLKIFRQSCTGVQRILQPVKHAHVNEGVTLDQLIHDIYVKDLIGGDLQVECVDDVIFMPKDIGSERFLRIDGGTNTEASEENALARVKAVITSGDIEVELHGSWVGLSDETSFYDKKICEGFDESLIKSEYLEVDGKSFLNQEAKFVVVEGERNLVCDLLNQRIYDLEHGKELSVDVFPRDQLYRVLECAVVDAAGESVEDVSEEDIDEFMGALFDIQELVGEMDVDVFEALDEAGELIDSMIVTDKAELEKDDLKGVAS